MILRTLIFDLTVLPFVPAHLGVYDLLQSGFLESSLGPRLDHLLHPLVAVLGIHLHRALGGEGLSHCVVLGGKGLSYCIQLRGYRALGGEGLSHCCTGGKELSYCIQLRGYGTGYCKIPEIS